LAVAHVIGVHGIRGEVKAEILTEDPSRFRLLKRVFIGLEGEEPRAWGLKGHRLHRGRVLLKLEGCDDRDTAETLRGCLVLIPLDEAIPLAEGEYYEHQVVGLEAWTDGGESLGEVVQILYTGANDVYVVRNPHGEILIPAIAGVIREVDLEGGRLMVHLPEGLR
jgi:16S rRNA processing protein RimM